MNNVLALWAASAATILAEPTIWASLSPGGRTLLVAPSMWHVGLAFIGLPLLYGVALLALGIASTPATNRGGSHRRAAHPRANSQRNRHIGPSRVAQLSHRIE